MQAICIAELLEDAGAQIIGPAATSSAALDLIAQNRLHAALLDANLGGRPVDDVAAGLAGQNVPFVFISGHSRSKMPPSFSNVDLLAKPFSAKTLFAAVHKLVA